MRVPKNEIAEAIQKFEQENESLLESINFINESIRKNQAAITELETAAVWEEVVVDEPVVEASNGN